MVFMILFALGVMVGLPVWGIGLGVAQSHRRPRPMTAAERRQHIADTTGRTII